MKTPQQIKNKVEKEISFLSLRIENMPLGKDQDILVKRRNGLRDKFSILTEYDKSIKEMIEERVNFYEKLWLKAVDEQNKHQEDIFYNTYFNLKELLSKIGDGSEVEK